MAVSWLGKSKSLEEEDPDRGRVEMKGKWKVQGVSAHRDEVREPKRNHGSYRSRKRAGCLVEGASCYLPRATSWILRSSQGPLPHHVPVLTASLYQDGFVLSSALSCQAPQESWGLRA